ncbi:PREDICTED: macrophage mannose receptor 1-like [Acropora digitifera]|uniref:macrophage mannose receptor 1-like n=1 Tax=Acropora digitifera TaxID=70779 RepID=UPI00077AE268|nr:PREDICTED: macrophage mannose receptor 1-like [Acropora digitifera]
MTIYSDSSKKNEEFLRRMPWKAYFFLNPGTISNTKDPYSFKSTKNPPPVEELKQFENDMLKMIQSTKFKQILSSPFLRKLKDDATRIKNETKLLIAADKTTNFYKLEPCAYNDLLEQNITKPYKKSTTWHRNVQPTIFPTTPTGPKLKLCKKGWIYYEKKCYLLVSKSKQTWVNARNICREGLNGRMKGDLVTVDDQYEQAFLITALIGRQSLFWIGLNDFHVAGSFYWTDSSLVKYTNWGAGQPSRRWNCVSMTSFGRWITKKCWQLWGYICEAGALPDYTNSTVAPTQNRTSECPLHYNMIGDDCYFVSSIKLTWKDAREVCKGESNGDLISVHSPIEKGKITTGQNNINRNFGSHTAKGLRFGGRKTNLHGTRTRVKLI